MNLSPGLLRRARRTWSDIASEFANVVPHLTEDQMRLLEAAARDCRDLLAKTEPRKAPAKALPEKSRKQAKTARRLMRADETARVREHVWLRSEGRCECGCGIHLADFKSEGELDHWREPGEPRARCTTVARTWRLSPLCHRHKTLSRPSRAHWIGLFATHCRLHGYPVPSMLAKRTP